MQDDSRQASSRTLNRITPSLYQSTRYGGVIATGTPERVRPSEISDGRKAQFLDQTIGRWDIDGLPVSLHRRPETPHRET